MILHLLVNDKLLDRFWSKVNKKSDEECWEWTAAKLRDGYGNIRINKHMAQAHRVSWVIHFGEIPDGVDVLHRCDNPSCVNPNHLFLGDDKLNCADRQAKNRQAKHERHGNAKLDMETVLQFRDMYSSGLYSIREMGRKFNVSYSNMRCILQNRLWT